MPRYKSVPADIVKYYFAKTNLAIRTKKKFSQSKILMSKALSEPGLYIKNSYFNQTSCHIHTIKYRRGRIGGGGEGNAVPFTP